MQFIPPLHYWFSRLCLKMSSFLHTFTWVMPRTFLPSREILFPVYAADRISSLESVLMWLSRWGVEIFFSGNILLSYQRLSSIEGRLPSKFLFCRRSSSVEGRLPLKVVFRRRSSTVDCRLPSKVVFCQRYMYCTLPSTAQMSCKWIKQDKLGCLDKKICYGHSHTQTLW